MKKPNPLLLWTSFFLTTAIVFGAIITPSYHYWSKTNDMTKTLIVGGAAAFLFGMVYASYKIRTLYQTTIDLDFSHLEVDIRERLGKELRRLGYREQGTSIFPAGFRADYYMAPDITLEIGGNGARITGPKFYLTKLFKRHRKYRNSSLRKIGHMTDGAHTKFE